MRIPFLSSFRPNKAWLVLGVAIVIGGLAALAARSYLSNRVADLEGRARGKNLSVVVAKIDLIKGSKLSTENVAVRPIPEEYAHSTAVLPDQFERIEGQVLVSNVKAGEMILWGLVESKKPPTFSARVEAGHRAITVPVDEINSISGMLEPGDLIDLMVTLEKNGKKRTIPLLQSVQIMATGQRSVDDPKSGERRLYSTVTLDTDLVQAQNLIMAREVGHLTALLRNPQDKALTARSQSEISTLLGLTSAGKDSASGAVDVPVLYGGGAAKLPPEGLHMGSPLPVVNTGEISAPKPNTPIQVQVVPTPGQGIPGSVAGAAR